MENGFRVKLYFLNGPSWLDKGTGFVKSDNINNKLSLIAKSETDGSILIEHKINPDVSYHRQQDTLILWTDSNGDDIALSFQEKSGRDNLWKQICKSIDKDPNELENDEEVEVEQEEEEESSEEINKIPENFIKDSLKNDSDTLNMDLLPKDLNNKRKSDDIVEDALNAQNLSPLADKKTKNVSSALGQITMSDFQHNHNYFHYDEDFDDSDIDKYSSPFITETLTSSNYLTNNFGFFDKGNHSTDLTSTKDFSSLNTLGDVVGGTNFLTSNSILNATSTFTSPAGSSILNVGFDDSLCLPECDMAHLAEIEALVTEYVGHGNLITLTQANRREKLSLAIENTGYLTKLLETFRMCEDLEDLDGLHHMYAILKNLFFLNRNAILEILLADNAIVDVIGCLEYDPMLQPNTKTNSSLKSKIETQLNQSTNFVDDKKVVKNLVQPINGDSTDTTISPPLEALHHESGDKSQDDKTLLLPTNKDESIQMEIDHVAESFSPVTSKPEENKPETISFLNAHRQNHREYILKEAKFKKAVPITNKELLRKIHQTYRVQYIQDVIFPQPSIFEENMLSSLTSFIFFNKLEIVNYIQEDDQILKDVFNQLSSESITLEQKRNLILFFKEYCHFSQTLQSQSKDNFFKAIMSKGILNVIESLLPCEDEVTRNAIIDVIWFLVEFNPSQIREFSIKECQSAAQDEDTHLINVLIEQMICDPDIELGNAMQISLILKTLSDPDNMSTSVNKSEKTEFLSLFYKHNMHNLIAPLLANTTEAKPNKDDYKTAHLLSIIIEILSFYVAHHTFHSKNYFINKDILKRALVLMQSKHHFLILCALRLFRNILNLKDEFYNRYIVKGDLLKPVIDAFLRNGTRYNLLNSAVLELFDYLYMEDVKSLITYFVEIFYLEPSNGISKITYTDVFKKLDVRYDQIIIAASNSASDRSPETCNKNAGNLDEESKSPNSQFKSNGLTRANYFKKSPDSSAKGDSSSHHKTNTVKDGLIVKDVFNWNDDENDEDLLLFNHGLSEDLQVTAGELEDYQDKTQKYDEELERRQEDAWFDADEDNANNDDGNDLVEERTNTSTNEDYGPPIPRLFIKKSPKGTTFSIDIKSSIKITPPKVKENSSEDILLDMVTETPPTTTTNPTTNIETNSNSDNKFKQSFSPEVVLANGPSENESTDTNNTSQLAEPKKHKHIIFSLNFPPPPSTTSTNNNKPKVTIQNSPKEMTPQNDNQTKMIIDLQPPATTIPLNESVNINVNSNTHNNNTDSKDKTGKMSPIPSLVAYEQDSEEEEEEIE